MFRMYQRRRTLTLSALLLSACASTGVVPTDRGTYRVDARRAYVGRAEAARADVHIRAADFCGNKRVETVAISSTPSGFFRRASASMEFKCMN